MIFAGYRNDVREILKISDIFCFPSYREGLSVALMEAMAVGLPVICSKIRGNVDLISENEGGYLCQPKEIEQFKKYIEYLYINSEIRNRFGVFNRKKIKKFSLFEIHKYMKNIYKNI